MSKAASADHPNLALAVDRLRRLQVLWGLLLAALAALSLVVGGGGQVLLPATWLLIAVLLIARPQPILLALVAVTWGFSLLFLFPGVRAVFGADPISTLFSTEGVEAAAFAVVRVLLLVTAWNQFLFYRLLYGTEMASGLDPDLPAIPAVVPNPSDAVAVGSRFIGFIGLTAALLAVPLAPSAAGATSLSAGLGLATVAVGLGLGSAFAPTRRRPMALAGILLGCLALLATLLVGRGLYS